MKITAFPSVLLLFTFIFCFSACAQDQKHSNASPTNLPSIETGAAQLDKYMHLVNGKQVGMVVNQTSVVGEEHIVDFLLKNGVSVKKVFAPEHGFRGTADAGEKVADGVDKQTGLPIVSLYGSNRKPSPEQLEELDIIIFDIQDVGARFYTYISTLEYVMEACAEQKIPFIVFDRPNPNGFYVDGPVLDDELKSFVGMQNIPVVHGMTVGEYAKMLNGEKLLKNGVQADLTVVKNKHYTHSAKYNLPIAPSPNLPNQQSILLYPSLCFFEGTKMSVGRGTNKQFQIYGSPNFEGSFTFMPVSMAGAKYPKHENKLCHGVDLSSKAKREIYSAGELNLTYLIDAYRYYSQHNQPFFLDNNFFDKLAGTYELRKQLTDGLSEEEIRASWEADLSAFKKIRKKYLLYEDFE